MLQTIKYSRWALKKSVVSSKLYNKSNKQYTHTYSFIIFNNLFISNRHLSCQTFFCKYISTIRTIYCNEVINKPDIYYLNKLSSCINMKTHNYNIKLIYFSFFLCKVNTNCSIMWTWDIQLGLKFLQILFTLSKAQQHWWIKARPDLVFIPTGDSKTLRNYKVKSHNSSVLDWKQIKTTNKKVTWEKKRKIRSFLFIWWMLNKAQCTVGLL